MPSNYRYLPNVISSFSEDSAAVVQDGISAALSAMGVLAPTEEVSEYGIFFNSIVAAGEGGIGFSLAKDFSHVHGINHRLNIGESIEIKKDAVLSNLRFFTTKVPETAVIRLRGKEEPQIIFNGCTFVRGMNHGDKPFIEVEDGVEAVFVGCAFIGLNGTDERSQDFGMVDTLNASVLDVQFVGCSRYPRNSWFTTHSTDAGGTKTGCS